jgi:hypothetical protein
MPDAEATARTTTHLHRFNEELRESEDSVPPRRTRTSDPQPSQACRAGAAIDVSRAARN